MTDCPDDDDFVRWSDGALSVDDAERVRAHVARCARCLDRDEALRALIADLGAPVSGERVDARAQARAVMGRLERVDRVDPSTASARSRASRRRWGAIAGSAAACALGLALAVDLQRSRESAAWLARGGSFEATLARDVGVQPYVIASVDGAPVRAGLRALTSGARLDPATPLTAGFRNLGRTPAYLLLFAVDAHRSIHWISPSYARPGDDPSSTALPPTVDERVLETTAVFEDVVPGPLRVVAVITSAPAHVSDVEAFEGLELDASRLVQRLPGADVRETVIEALDAKGGTP